MVFDFTLNYYLTIRSKTYGGFDKKEDIYYSNNVDRIPIEL